MIESKDLVKTFIKSEGKKKSEFAAVDNISFKAGEGEIVGILGPNGAGKTTLLRMLASLLTPTSGEVSIEINGNKLVKAQDIKKNIGYLSGNTKLYDRLSTREMLEVFGRLYGLSEFVIEERIKTITSVLNMSEFIDNRIEKLSTGQTQRASIARCLIHSPEIYIFDEPTLGLDIISSSAIVEFMRGEKKKKKTIIYSTHYMEEAEYLCDRIMMLNNGHVVCDMTPAQLKKETGANNMREAFYSIIESEGIRNEK